MFPQEEVIRQASRCTGCGFCLEVCPVYQSLGVETFSSRGRIDLIRGVLSDELRVTDRIGDVLSMCLLCMACQSSCPSGVTIQELILEGRQRVVETKGLPVVHRWAFRRLLRDRQALGRVLAIARRIMEYGRGTDDRPIRHLPTILSNLAGGRALPLLADASLRHRISPLSSHRPGTKYGGRIGLFGGCFLEFVDTSMGEAGIRVLNASGYDVVYPAAQVCCGAPVLYSGALEDALQLATINAQAFADQELQAVVTLCATCGNALREGYQALADHLKGEHRDRVLSLSRKIVDVSEILVQTPGLPAQIQEVPITVTYHDPCHHVRGLGIHREPRELLSRIPGLRLVEMADPARCCGGGGSFGLTHPDISKEVGRWKVEHILSTGAQAAVTACPGCILQIQDVSHREPYPMDVLHLVEVLDRALYPHHERS